MKKPLQVITVDHPEFQDLLELLQPKFLVGNVKKTACTEAVYALPLFMVVQESNKKDQLSIQPCHNQLEASQIANDYLIESEKDGAELV